MIVAVLLDHILDAIGVFYIITVSVKVSRGFHVTRWFF